MDTNLLFNAIAELQEKLDGELIDRSRVIDGLLDLRQMAAEVVRQRSSGPSLIPGESSLVDTVDILLSNVPGKTMVDMSWWQTALVSLAAATEPQPA